MLERFGVGGGGSLGLLTGLFILVSISECVVVDDIGVACDWLGGGGALRLGTRSISSSSLWASFGLLYGIEFLFDMYLDTYACSFRSL